MAVIRWGVLMRLPARAGLVGLLALVLIGLAASPAFAEPKSPDPVSDTYSPVAWATVWKTDSLERNGLPADNPQVALERVGLLVYAGHEQWNALTTADRAMLRTAYQNDLVELVWQRARAWMTTATNAPSAVPTWSVRDSNAAAKFLGGTSYRALSPGLKGVVQRIATIVTGDLKPPMPDEAWMGWMSPATKAAFVAQPDRRFDWTQVNLAAPVNPDTVNVACPTGPAAFLFWNCEATLAAAEVAEGVIDFISDPLGWITRKAGDGAVGIITWIANTANAATAPDLTKQWWIDTYEKGMAVGIILFGLLLLYQFVEKARGNIDAQQFLEIFYKSIPLFFAGIVFGPPLGQFLISGSTWLGEDIVKAWFGTSTSEGLTSIKDAADKAGDGATIGGAFVALLFLILMILAGFFVFIALAIQTATVYLTGVVFAVAFAWIVSVRHRGGSMRIPMLFIGLVFARPLLFFMVGAGIALVKDAVAMSGDTLAENLATMVMAVVVLVVAGFSPLLLLKFAPVSPHGMEAASAAGPPRVGRGSGATDGMTKLQSLSMRGVNAVRSRIGGQASSGGGGSAGGGGGSGAATATLTRPGSAMDEPASATSLAGHNGSSGSVGERLGRSRRHGGGTPSAGAAAVAAARPSDAGRSGSSGERAIPDSITKRMRPSDTPESVVRRSKPSRVRGLGASAAWRDKEMAGLEAGGRWGSKPVRAAKAAGAGVGKAAGMTGRAAAPVAKAAAKGVGPAARQASRAVDAAGDSGRSVADAVGGDRPW